MTKTFKHGDQTRPVFDSVNIDLPTDRHCAILGEEQSGKSTLIRMLAGVEDPNRGGILRYANLSFPVGYVRALRPQMTPRQNIEHAARLYGADPDEISAFVQDVTGFDDQMDHSLKGMQQKDRVVLAYALSYAIPFDTYLIDEHIALGSPDFRQLCHAMFAHRAQDSGILLATSDVKKVLDYCDLAAVIHEGKLTLFSDVREAVDLYKDRQARRPPKRSFVGGGDELDSTIESA
jgi:capsular polysaccharide transport system ATP-binding protein